MRALALLENWNGIEIFREIKQEGGPVASSPTGANKLGSKYIEGVFWFRRCPDRHGRTYQSPQGSGYRVCRHSDYHHHHIDHVYMRVWNISPILTVQPRDVDSEVVPRPDQVSITLVDGT
jgi:hypothetical protein